MNKDYKRLTESIRGRVNPDRISLPKAFLDELATISYSDVLSYVRIAMKGVEPEYTQRSKDAGEKVKTHLTNQLPDVVFRYQGSVMTNTHIKGHSDIDLLTISDKFYTYAKSRIKTILESTDQRQNFYESSIQKLEREMSGTPYQGNSLVDLMTLRQKCEEILSAEYMTCDCSKPKSIKLTNHSLKREVDVVIANWYDDVTSIINDKGINRGIEVFNKLTITTEKPDYPFVSIERINNRTSETNGRLGRMIRFIKNVKADSGLGIDLSSFDINAICYDMKQSTYETLAFYQLVPAIYVQLRSICNDSSHADNIVSVDGREYIFRGASSKLDSVRALLTEVESINSDL